MSGWEVGEWVAVVGGRGRDRWTVGQVTAVTPSGQARACGRRWTARGSEVGGGTWGCSIVRIAEAEAIRFERARVLRGRWSRIRQPPSDEAATEAVRRGDVETLRVEIDRLRGYRATVDGLIEALEAEAER